MINLAIVEKSETSRSLFLESCELPDSYMEDFTILGITVSSYSKAEQVILQNGHHLTSKSGGGKLQLNAAYDIQNILETLLIAGLSPELCDIADTIYQA